MGTPLQPLVQHQAYYKLRLLESFPAVVQDAAILALAASPGAAAHGDATVTVDVASLSRSTTPFVTSLSTGASNALVSSSGGSGAHGLLQIVALSLATRVVVARCLVLRLIDEMMGLLPPAPLGRGGPPARHREGAGLAAAPCVCKLPVVVVDADAHFDESHAAARRGARRHAAVVDASYCTGDGGGGGAPHPRPRRRGTRAGRDSASATEAWLVDLLAWAQVVPAVTDIVCVGGAMPRQGGVGAGSAPMDVLLPRSSDAVGAAAAPNATVATTVVFLPRLQLLLDEHAWWLKHGRGGRFRPVLAPATEHAARRLARANPHAVQFVRNLTRGAHGPVAARSETARSAFAALDIPAFVSGGFVSLLRNVHRGHDRDRGGGGGGGGGSGGSDRREVLLVAGNTARSRALLRAVVPRHVLQSGAVADVVRVGYGVSGRGRAHQPPPGAVAGRGTHPQPDPNTTDGLGWGGSHTLGVRGQALVDAAYAHVVRVARARAVVTAAEEYAALALALDVPVLVVAAAAGVPGGAGNHSGDRGPRADAVPRQALYHTAAVDLAANTVSPASEGFAWDDTRHGVWHTNRNPGADTLDRRRAGLLDFAHKEIPALFDAGRLFGVLPFKISPAPPAPPSAGHDAAPTEVFHLIHTKHPDMFGTVNYRVIDSVFAAQPRAHVRLHVTEAVRSLSQRCRVHQASLSAPFGAPPAQWRARAVLARGA